MCLYPKKIKNKKYISNDKNKGIIPEPPIIDNSGTVPVYDERVLYIEVPCGECIECRQTKAREWQIRLSEEIKQHKFNYFITLTFAPEELRKILKKTNLTECNAVAEYAVRHMLERFRKDYKKSIKHWLITELGHEGTERIHLHGILFSDNELEFSEKMDNNLRNWKYWKYGHIYIGDYVNQKTINYISKYITKIDNDHKNFKGQILASPGIGKTYIDKLEQLELKKLYPKHKIDYYRLENGAKVKLPTYYKNKLYNEKEREDKWREFMDAEKINILGNEHSLNTPSLPLILEKAKDTNTFHGYGNDTKEWRKKDYNITKRMLQHAEREKQKDKMKEALEKRIKQSQYENNYLNTI